MTPQVGESLNVVALISGGKDSFFSVLHCRANGLRVVALANLHPPPAAVPTTTGQDEGEEDLNSFMYQTVGHEVIPLYAEATGLPLYRQAITGGAGGSGKDYARGEDGDETESMVPLLRQVMAAHPEVNAICAGAILSTYQRTRVESVAVRLGLTPVAYLWKYPVLPLPAGRIGGAGDDSQLLEDMRDAGMEARIIKVASGGLDEEFLWEDVASQRGVDRLLRAMRRFGGAVAGSGAVIGEGGEFETLVVDGPPGLFRKRIVIEEGDRKVVREGGGTAWLRARKARVEDKDAGDEGSYRPPRIPGLLGARFAGVLHGLDGQDGQGLMDSVSSRSEEPLLKAYKGNGPANLRQWCVVGDVQSTPSIEAETTSLIEKITTLLREASLPSTSIVSTVIALRHMSSFPTINKIYGSLFTQPNPPSRVTISCGDLLPSGCNIAVYLSVHHDLAPSARQGLHVQSRSYWAPANIGPYSQAISIPISSLSSSGDSDSGSTAASLVHIAGQIPLIPATMDLPDPSKSFSLSAALALQHLWRIGAETGVQWWSSAVAYLPHTPDESASPKEKALVASRIWRAAHDWSPEDAEDEEAGPDLWDRTHNPAYMSFGANDGTDAKTGGLPDRSVLVDSDDDVSPPPPALFVAEVQELPRQARVEWHVHLGFAHLDDTSVRVVSLDSEMMQVQHTLVTVTSRDEEQGGGGVFVHTVLAVKRGQQTEKMPLTDVLGEMRTLYLARIAALTGSGETAEGLGDVAPAHLYVDSGAVEVEVGDAGKEGCPVIPCFSLWDRKGEDVLAVAVYQEWLVRCR